MPDPISSSCVPPDLTCNSDADPALSCELPVASSPPAAAPNACLPPALPAEPALSTAPAPSPLAQKFLRSAPASFIAATSAPAPSSAPSSTSVTVAPPVFSASGSAHPLQLNFQAAAIPRVEGHAAVSGLHLTGAVDVLSGNVHFGTQNEDGSHGANVGGGVALIGVEGTAEYKGWSLTLGAAAHSEGGSIASGGGRDIDGDGVPERCFKMTLGPFTLGECDEL